MVINRKKEGTKLTVAPVGRIDTITAPEFEVVLKDEIEGVSELSIDFKEVDYISSAGLRVLLTAQRTMNTQGTMEVLNVNDSVKEILEVTGFDSILTIK